VALVKTTRIVQPDGKVTVIKSSHSFGCGWIIAFLLLAYAIGSMPILLLPTIVIVGAMLWAKAKQSR
jgi:hypothetical protein